MIELYAKLIISTKEILRLLDALTTSNSSTNEDPINSTKIIIYYGGLIQRATIIKGPNGYGQTYTCVNLKTMSISHNCSFSQLFHNISETQYGDQKQVAKINYHV